MLRSRSLLAAALAAGLLSPVAAAHAAPSAPVLSLYAGSGSGAPVAGPALASPLGMVFRAAVAKDGTLFLPDLTHRVISKVTPEGELSIVAGTPGTSGTPTEGPAATSRLGTILGAATDDAGNLYVYDSGARRILKIDTDGQLTFVAGTGTSATPTSPLGADARSTPIATGGPLAVDDDGNVFFADTTRYQVLKITPSGAISAVAGLGGGTDGAFVEGPALASPMDPLGLEVDGDGDLYIANRVDFRIAKVSAATGELAFYAGDGTNDPLEEGPALTSSAHQPTNLALEDDGDLLFTDSTAGKIGKVTADGDIVHVAGSGTGGGSSAPTPGDPLASPITNFSLTAVGDGTYFTSAAGAVARIGRPEPLAPTAFAVTSGDGLATIAFLNPVDVGSAPVSAYEVSTDGGATWQPLTVTSGAGRARTATVTLANGASYPVAVRVRNAFGASPATAVRTATPTAAPVPVPELPTAVTPAAPRTPGVAPPAATPRAEVPAPVAVAACRATRKVRVHWSVPRRTRVRSIMVTVDGKARRLAASTRALAVTLDPATGREHTVRITARTVTGKRLTSVRTYRLCTSERRGALRSTVLR